MAVIVQPRPIAVGEPGELSNLLDQIRPDWMRRARCLGAGNSRWFVDYGQTASEAKAICAQCPVQRECLAYALPQPGLVGVWGGKSEVERQRMRMKVRPL